MASSAKFAAPNSLVLVADTKDAEVPDSMSGSLIVSTNSCVAIGCRADVDGETEFILGATGEVHPGDKPAYKQMLMTPNRRIAIRSVLGQTIVEMPVPHQQTMVRVWVNDSKEPDRVIVGID